MENTQFKRNIIAIAVAIPVIALLSALTSLFDGGDSKAWNWSDVWDIDPVTDILHVKSKSARLLDLSGRWRFTLGDAAEWADRAFDDSSWDEIRVPKYWEDDGYKNYDGFAWYRRNFELDGEALRKSLYLKLGQIDDVDEVFINGERVGGLGQFPPTYVGAYNQNRHYTIPAGILQEEGNVIAVRVYDAQMGGGIYKGDIGIYASKFPAPLVNLEGQWQFRTSKKEPFRFIHVPGVWERQGADGYDGIAWYKKEFAAVDVNTDDTLVLLLGKIDDTDEVFINGELVGRTGSLEDGDRKVDPDYYSIMRSYEFPASVLRNINTIEVRVHDSGGFGGIYEGPVRIVTLGAYRRASHD